MMMDTVALGLTFVFFALSLAVMHLATPPSAILSAVIFNALIIVLLIPLALRGVRYRAVGTAVLLRDNLLLYGLGGLVYPVAVTAVAQLCFPVAANGSLVVADGRVVGSALIGQPFDDPRYFWGRPSATAPTPYDAASSASRG
jgi:hypothetical protein